MNTYLPKPFEPTALLKFSAMPLNSTELVGVNTSNYCSSVLIMLFNELFVPSMHTRLCGGREEPIYVPANESGCLNEIYFTRNYFASALHEIAHWCLAGPARLKQVDYGYWYAPDGRTQAQQLEFERVEVKPQALEWIFSVACGLRFAVSADNLAQGLGPSLAFKLAVVTQARAYCALGLPHRATLWLVELVKYFKCSDPLTLCHYQRDCLGE